VSDIDRAIWLVFGMLALHKGVTELECDEGIIFFDWQDATYRVTVEPVIER
jgi:hypothetical protein